MNIVQMLKNHVADMDAEVERLQDEINELRIKKEAIQRQAIKLKSKLATIPKDQQDA
ncbi:hypothetical protein [Endozoicomonas sp. GU-1]|uniref:hypothetical protein n=1 Tax=Endozoicomonas sp. GU-1 TaxID=3009078 RepID=UPI0022B34155|nr:hypothetical protein [Endozoicomonas sp. GU-1]WBA79598.1 hypothetical protein O2T12_14535 [Endozoicomonas sp. GU-1]